MVNLWVDTKIEAGARWREEIQAAIEVATVAVTLVSADFLASDFISEYELPEILSRAESGGTTIMSLIVSPCLFDSSGLEVFQTVNPPNHPLVMMNHAEQEQTLVKLAIAIQRKLVAGES